MAMAMLTAENSHAWAPEAEMDEVRIHKRRLVLE